MGVRFQKFKTRHSFLIFKTHHAVSPNFKVLAARPTGRGAARNANRRINVKRHIMPARTNAEPQFLARWRRT
jgi:hypothetical protein